MSGATQLSLYAEVQDALIDRLVWFSRNMDFASESIEAVVARFHAGVQEVSSVLDRAVASPHAMRALKSFARLMCLESVASQLVRLSALVETPDVVRVAAKAGRAVGEVAEIHFALEDVFGFKELVEASP